MLEIKYRPRTLDEIGGQEHVKARLRGIFESGAAIPTAFLFIGQSGIGKTTLGRWLSNRLNCRVSKGVEPCGKCIPCLGYTSEPPTSESHIEINASADTGIEGIRQLAQKAKYRPMGGGKRVHFIDEPQGLSKQAMQALLKPVESTQPWNVWVFATTDPQKLSRALKGRFSSATFNLLPLTVDDMKPVFKRILKAEAAALPNKASRKKLKALKLNNDQLSEIMEATRGQARDAIGILESLIQTVLSSDEAPNLKALLPKVLISSKSGATYGYAKKLVHGAVIGGVALHNAMKDLQACNIDAAVILKIANSGFMRLVLSALTGEKSSWQTKATKHAVRQICPAQFSAASAILQNSCVNADSRIIASPDLLTATALQMNSVMTSYAVIEERRKLKIEKKSKKGGDMPFEGDDDIPF